MTDRGVTPVLGLVLLLGLVSIAALSLLVVSASVFDGPQTAVETNQAEDSLSQLAATTDRLTGEGGGDGSYAVRGSDGASVEVAPDAGWYEVRIERSTGTEVLTNGSLGAYRYTAPDDTVLAYQGGGVWRGDPAGESRLVRPPEFHYRSTPEPTLTLPVVRIDGSVADAAPSDGDVRVSSPRNVYPRRPTHRNPMDSGAVYVEVGSAYCEGWEQFFRERTDGALAETCEDTDETSDDEVLVHLTVPFSFEGLDGNAAVASRPVEGSGSVHGPTEIGPHEYPSASGVVETRVEDCEDGEGRPLSSSVTQPGLYCSLSAPMDGSYDFDTSAGDVEVVVDDVVDPNDVDITGGGNVTVFANGDAFQSPANDLGDPSHPERLRFVLHSDVRFGDTPASCGGGGPPGGPGGPGGGNADVYGLIYAPNSTVGFAGNVDVHGGVVADEICLRSGSSEIHHEPTVSEITMEYGQGGEPFYYLHVSEATVEIDD